MSKLVNIMALSAFTLVLAAGQLLFKHVGDALRGRPLSEAALVLTRQPALYAALCLYGLSTLLWIWILSRIPLTQAYPWVAVGIIVVPILSHHVYSEAAGPLYWLGAALCAVGVLLTQYSS